MPLDLVNDRCVTLSGQITNEIARDCVAQLLFLSYEWPRLPIRLCLDSPGGRLSAALDIVCVLDELPCPVCTFCRGQVGGTTAFIVAHGTPGLRTASPAAQFAFAPTFAELRDAHPDADLSQSDQALVELLAQSISKVEPETDLLFGSRSEFAATDALALGLIDLIADAPPTGPMLLLRWCSGRIQRLAHAASAGLSFHGRPLWHTPSVAHSHR